MGNEIRYCDRCGKLVPPGEVSGGKAFASEHGTVCVECLRILTPQQRAALSDSAPAEARSAADSGTRRAALTRSGGPPPARRGSPIVPVSILVGVCCGAAIALMAMGVGDSPEEQFRDGAATLAEPVASPPVAPEPTRQPVPPPLGAARPPASVRADELTTPRARLDEVVAMITADLGHHDDVVQALKYFPTDYPNTPEATEAQRLLVDVEKRHAVLADAALADALKTAADLETAGRLNAAISMVRAVQARYRGSAWALDRGDAEAGAVLERLLAAEREKQQARETSAAAASRPRAPGGLAVHWTFDDLERDGTFRIIGSDLETVRTEGRSGGAVVLDGHDDYVVTPRTLKGHFPDESITAVIWLRPESAGVILDELGSPTPSTGWHNTLLEISPAGNVEGRVWGDVGRISLGAAALGQWHVVALRYDAATQKLSGFLDGRLSPDEASGGRLVNQDTFFAIGPGESQNMGNGGHLRGVIDEVRIYARALPDDEVKAVMAGDEAPDAPAPTIAAVKQELETPPDGSLDTDPALVARFTFDDGAGLTFRNAAGVGTGALKRMDAASAWVQGKSGRGLWFNGQDDYAEFKPIPAFAYGPGVTFALWLKAEEGENPVIMDQAGNDQYLSLSMGPDSRVRWEVAGGDFVFGTPIERGVWHHLAGTYDAKTGASTLYIDGKQDGTANYTVPTDYTGIPIFLSSRGADAKGVRGTYDDIRVYARALTAQEVRILHGQIDAQIAALAKTPEERRQLLSEGAATVGRDGYALDLQMLVDLAQTYDATRTTSRRIAAVGGALAASNQFDAHLRTVFTARSGYTYSGRMGLASRSLTAAKILARLKTNLVREKPEFVRILPGHKEAARPGAVASLRRSLVKICEVVQSTGAVPVLMTQPLVDGTGDARVDALIDTCNEAIRSAVAEARVPHIDAFAYLNRDAEAKQRNFGARGTLSKAGRADLGRRTAALYRVVERWVMRRGGGDGDRGDVGVGVVAPGRAVGINLVPNPGFERVDGVSKFAESWSVHNWGDAAAAWSVRLDRATSHAGRNSITVRSLGKGAMPGVYARLPEPLPAGAYELSMWASAEAEQSVAVVATLGDHALGEMRIGEDWTRVVLKFDVAEERRGDILRLRLATSPARVWIDDVALTRAAD